MRIHAYVLAADPTWLRQSVTAYYPHIEKLVASYDGSSRGYTGTRVRVEECKAILAELDAEGKVEYVEGDFVARPGETYLDAETRQRRVSLEHAAPGADWVLQIDTDEVLPDWPRLVEVLERAAQEDVPAVEWPMRVLFRRLHDGRYLEVATSAGTTHVEYPGAVAIRPGVELVEGRRTSSRFIRPLVHGDSFSLQVTQPPDPKELRLDLLDVEAAIWHNSWGRSVPAMREKVASWSHNGGLRSWWYFASVWLPSPLTWRLLRQFHPLHRPLWPRLRASAELRTRGVDG